MDLFDVDRLTEYELVEKPFINQLVKMGWEHLEGDIDIPYLTERENFHQVLLLPRLREALRRINLDDEGNPWLDDARIDTMIRRLESLGPLQLMEANERVTELLLKGTEVEGLPDWDGGRGQICRYIDFRHPEKNDFLVINQFRVDPPWVVGNKGFIVPDLVLFVNGIPLVVVECKNPERPDPMNEAIEQLLRYSNQRQRGGEPEGAERLFHYNQLMIATYRYEARVGAIGASPEFFAPWRDTSPVPQDEVRAELGVDSLNAQELLVAGMLRPTHLLDIIRNFIVFKKEGHRTTKLVCRYQQFRAVHKAIQRLLTGQTRNRHGTKDQRGGIVWHYQGSGKSLTMVFLVRKLRTYQELRNFKVVIVTDRTDLEEQLEKTAALTGETIYKANNIKELFSLLRRNSPDLVFGMIQKMQVLDEDAEIIEFNPQKFLEQERAALKAQEEREATVFAEAVGEVIAEAEQEPQGKTMKLRLPTKKMEVLNASEEIVVIVDEAHRSHSNVLHQNLIAALPNAALIGFTGTPILMGDRPKTEEIFGSFIDKYPMKDAEADGVIVPVKYEGRTTKGAVDSPSTLDQLFEDLFSDRTPEEIEAIKKKYATTTAVMESEKLIRAKAANMLRHYVDQVLPNGFKAQVVASSRLAVARYYDAFQDAHRELLKELAAFQDSYLELTDEQIQKYDRDTQFLIRAKRHEETIRRLEFAGVFSPKQNQPSDWDKFTDKQKQQANIIRFKKPLVHPDPAVQDGLAFLIVKDMLITGFDAPNEQVLYLDRFMQGHQLLQAIARVNRTFGGKKCGYVVDYCGIGTHLKEALDVYSGEDVEGVLPKIEDELPLLTERHRLVLDVFHSRGISDIRDIDACVDLLSDLKIRAEFIQRFKSFLESMDLFVYRPEGQPYMNDMKILAFINQAAANVYRDRILNLVGCSDKVRSLLDRYLVSRGIDPKIPPISVTDEDFPKVVGEKKTSKARASTMVHALRQYIREHEDDDPVYYQKLSEHLENILHKFAEHWDELEQYMKDLVNRVRAGRPDDGTGLDPRTEKPFLGVLEKEGFGGVDLGQEKRLQLARHVRTMLDTIREHISYTDFWRAPALQNNLRRWLIEYLDENDVVPYDCLEKTVDALLAQARKRHSLLVKR
ncbi:type I restriction enzyme [Moorella sp. E308F]|uniref:type I restriction endonuclease subunit R n=1 Tax=unclassified Neomoorella TaxID=2676739 RepID=UPI0010FFBDD7|nr:MULTISPECIES: type I restriction endonuclease subunit R [unclassified Moorella (in: firmicutes)]GEA15377.1 type I restriction enzyme [Moorella sp. E308F]GEA19762.1 type I restriction enzyme [Moorella sp. E306M]